ncbi:serine hydrolase [Mesorhizobium sp. VK4C]|uniref:serine hydrolase n=1 Tax=Mesorhizobium captivum TaxID=3072319 RepID=UPI002A23CF58|nr:serine hydrolase [Mesorhizobium sp. VK4C]MDX8502611.1 serine hydrolase [Mesorhizobium sp. VK4C]
MLASTLNPDLDVSVGSHARWNLPDYRRLGFHNLHTTARYGMSLRAPRVLPLQKDLDWTIGERPAVARFLAMRHFSAFLVLRGERILYEAYAPDFGPGRPHAIMSVTKTTLNFILGRAVASGVVDLDHKIRTYLPQIGTGYADATVRAVADMDVANDFSEDYGNPRSNINAMRTAFGWQLPAKGATEDPIRPFVCGIKSDDVVNHTGYSLYKSANSDVLGWLVERASGKALREWLLEIVEAAGIEGCFHITCDRQGVPQVSGGASLSARDLGRYGLLFARQGEGIAGQRVGDATFMEETRRLVGPRLPKPRDATSYSRHVTTNGTWFGHGGIGGQYMLANPDTGVVVVYLGVLENGSSDDTPFFTALVEMMSEVAAEC